MKIIVNTSTTHLSRLNLFVAYSSYFESNKYLFALIYKVTATALILIKYDIQLFKFNKIEI